jgi:hypothetical protein
VYIERGKKQKAPLQVQESMRSEVAMTLKRLCLLACIIVAVSQLICRNVDILPILVDGVLTLAAFLFEN